MSYQSEGYIYSKSQIYIIKFTDLKFYHGLLEAVELIPKYYGQHPDGGCWPEDLEKFYEGLKSTLRGPIKLDGDRLYCVILTGDQIDFLFFCFT